MRRLKFRREDGVAMTEFALILPIFMVIVAGLLGFGRVFFYWIQANHVANETARWAIVDRNPYGRLPTGPRASVARAQQHGANSASASSTRTPRSASRGKAPHQAWRSADGDGREAVHLRADPEHRQRSPFARPRPCASRPSRTVRPPPPTPRRVEHEQGAERRAWSGHRARCGDDPGVPSLDGSRRRCRQLVHAQATAPESSRRRSVCGRGRIPASLGGLRPGGKCSSEAGYGEDHRKRRSTIRRRRGVVRLRADAQSAFAEHPLEIQHADREPGER